MTKQRNVDLKWNPANGKWISPNKVRATRARISVRNRRTHAQDWLCYPLGSNTLTFVHGDETSPMAFYDFGNDRWTIKIDSDYWSSSFEEAMELMVPVMGAEAFNETLGLVPVKRAGPGRPGLEGERIPAHIGDEHRNLMNRHERRLGVSGPAMLRAVIDSLPEDWEPVADSADPRTNASTRLFALTPTQKAKVDGLSREHGVSRASIVRWLILNGIPALKKETMELDLDQFYAAADLAQI